MVAATGVLVAAVFYIINLRETTKNRKLTFTTNVMQNLQSKEANRRFIDLMNMDWKDFDDFKKKYDSRVNPENFADRASWMCTLDLLGYQYRIGLIDLEMVYQTNQGNVLNTWQKFKPIIEEYKQLGDYSEGAYSNFEFLANALARIRKEREPSWKGAPDIFKEDFDKTFFKHI
jgi:hypothetical protein